MKPILIVGDGDFSFTASLIRLWKNKPHVIASCLESESQVTQKYAHAQSHIKKIRQNNWRVRFEVDATQLKDKYPGVQFERIIFNFPHVGGKSDIGKNRKLIEDFFQSAASCLTWYGEVWVALCRGQGGSPGETEIRDSGNSWNIMEYAARAHFILRRLNEFKMEDYPGYCPTGFRSQEKSFNPSGALYHHFWRATPISTKSESCDVVDLRGEQFHVVKNIAALVKKQNNELLEETLRNFQSACDESKTFSEETLFHQVLEQIMVKDAEFDNSIPVVSASSSDDSVDIEANLFKVRSNLNPKYLCHSIRQQYPFIIEAYLTRMRSLNSAAQGDVPNDKDLIMFSHGSVYSFECSTSDKWRIIVSPCQSELHRIAHRLVAFENIDQPIETEMNVDMDSVVISKFLQYKSYNYVIVEEILFTSEDNEESLITGFLFAFNLNHIEDEPNGLIVTYVSNLFPPCFNHDMSFWLNDNSANYDENMIKTVLFNIATVYSESSCLSVSILDRYVARNEQDVERTSFCCRIIYKSDCRALSSLLCNKIQSYVRLAFQRIMPIELR